VYLNARIVAIETPAPREVVKAMAELTAHGHGAGCDWGIKPDHLVCLPVFGGGLTCGSALFRW
jgi:3-oxoacyl-[acyl-carrier-protein] synthase III